MLVAGAGRVAAFNCACGAPSFYCVQIQPFPPMWAGPRAPARQMEVVFYCALSGGKRSLGNQPNQWGRTVRCAKSRLFSTTGSHGSQGPEFCTLQPLLVHQGLFFFFSLMLATDPRVLNSAPPMLF